MLENYTRGPLIQVGICVDPACPTGRMLIDDEYLLERGLTEEDLKVYRYDKDFDPPRALAAPTHEGFGVKRGDVRKVSTDLTKDILPINSKL